MEYVLIALVVTAALAAVAWPLIKKDRAPIQLADDAVLETAIKRYRAALKRGTVCERCLRDNPDKSKFCADCGAELPATTAGTES
jgi:hypothetical protein